MKINHNVQALTLEEKEALKNALHFAFVYDVGLILILTNKGIVSWDCSNSVAALNYLKELGIKELK